MAVYKIFAESDASLYSYYPTQNTGLDEILEVASYNFSAQTLGGSDDLRRSLVKFADSDISLISQFTTGSWSANLKLYLANANGLTTDYTLIFHQVSQSWVMGTGKYQDDPVVKSGACWYTPGPYITGSTIWDTSTYYNTAGGGSITAISSSQSFEYKDSKDVDANVTNIVDSWFSGSENNGILVRHITSVENNPSSSIGLSFFSTDTHTIYPPTLEMKWDDSAYSTGSLSVVGDNQFVISVANNPGTFKSDTVKYNFRLSVRDKYPQRTFTTSSIYLNNKALPETSYWAVQDVKTEDIIIDFDDNYTKISCDSEGSYFSSYISGLEPERYYKLIFKVVLNTGETIEVDDNFIFKVIR